MTWYPQRWVLHVDLNAFFASVEMLYRTDKRHLPLIVGGDEEARRGIVLTKNQLAKKYGVQTGESVYEARKKCPNLVSVPADYPLYTRFSKQLHNLLREYSDRVEAFGLDEAWVDITQPGMTWRQAKRIADEIRYRTWTEMGLTASVGVSFNKPYAKLGSDMQKPNATTVITPSNFQALVWPLIAMDLLFVGPATMKKLYNRGIYTIGDLANCPDDMLTSMLHKNGLMLKRFARGEDSSPVMPSEHESPQLSIGHSSTTATDMVCEEDVRCLITLLMESVGAKMREQNVRGRCIHIGVRQSAEGLAGYGCQKTIKTPTSLTREIIDVAMSLYRDNRYDNLLPFRWAGISIEGLSSRSMPTQIDLFGDEERRLKEEALDEAVYWLKERYGQKSIQRGAAITNDRLTMINPKEDDRYKPPAAAYYWG